MTVTEMKKGDRALIRSLGGDVRLVRRLNALGLLPGTRIEITNTAPLGDPMVITFRGFSLALRRKDAADIHVEKEEM